MKRHLAISAAVWLVWLTVLTLITVPHYLKGRDRHWEVQWGWTGLTVAERLTPTLSLGQALKPDRPISYLKILPATYAKKPDGRVLIRILQGASPPKSIEEANRRTIQRIRINGSEIQDNQFLRLDLPAEYWLSSLNGLYLLISDAGLTNRTPVTFWAAKSKNWPAGKADLLTVSPDRLIARPASGHLSLKLGDDQVWPLEIHSFSPAQAAGLVSLSFIIALASLMAVRLLIFIGRSYRSAGPLFYREQWIILLAAAAALVLTVGWDLPSRERVDLLLSNNPARLLIDPEVKYRARHFLFETGSVDEMAFGSALAHLDWFRLDFDPHQYIYGGAYYYLANTAAHLLNWFDVNAIGEMDHPAVLSRLLHQVNGAALDYLAGRLINIVFYLLTLGLVMRIGTRLGGRLAGLIAGLAWATSSLAMEQSLTSKSHVAATAAVSAAFYFVTAARDISSRDRAALFGLFIGAGLCQSLTVGIVGLTAPILFLRFDRLDRSMIDVLWAWAVSGAIYLVCHLYILFNLGDFLSVMANHTGGKYKYALPKIAKLEAAFQAWSTAVYVPFVIIALGGLIYFTFCRRLPVRQRRAAASALVIVIISWFFTGVVPRLVLFCGALIALAAGLALAELNRRIGPQLTRGVKIAGLTALLTPALFLISLYVWDMADYRSWMAPTRKWAVRDEIGPDSSVGIVSRAYHPVFLPAFPFPLNLENQYTIFNRRSQNKPWPEFIVYSTLGRPTPGPEHQALLTGRYELSARLGHRPRTAGLSPWVRQAPAPKSALVYRRLEQPNR